MRLRALGAGLVLALALLPAAAGGVEQEATHITPPPQPPLAVISDSLAALKAAFNAASDRPRVLLELSPT